MVILAKQQTVARNPLLFSLPSDVNLTVMVVAVTGAGREEPENVWVVDPSLTSTVSGVTPDSVLNVANVSVIGSPVVDSSLQSLNNIFNIFVS